MIYQDALQVLHSRAAAATGVPDGTIGIFVHHDRTARDFARSMFGDLVPLEQIDELLAGMDVLTNNIGGTLMTASASGVPTQLAALYTCVAQVLTLGMLLNRETGR